MTCMCATGKGTAPNDSVWHLVLKILKEITSSSSS
jgi:hypothetical protein